MPTAVNVNWQAHMAAFCVTVLPPPCVLPGAVNHNLIVIGIAILVTVMSVITD